MNERCGRDGARGGLGAIVPHGKVLAPQWKMKRCFLEIFDTYGTLKTMF